MARSTFYYHLRRTKEPDKYAVCKAEIMRIYHEHKGRYGYRRITTEMKKRNFVINHKTVMRLMALCGIKSQVRLRKYRSYRGKEGIVAPNLLGRDFTADKPNRKWVTDVTEFSVFGRKLYLSPLMDLYNREIISYKLSTRAVFPPIMQMLEEAIEHLPSEPELIVHSGQGWQYTNKKFQLRLKKTGIKQTMSRKGNPLDNAVIESFFGVLKSELLYLQKFTSFEHFYNELEMYIEYYNNKRIKKDLKNMSPVQYRTHNI